MSRALTAITARRGALLAPAQGMPHAAIVERIHRGRSSIVLGGMPDLPKTIAVVRVRCDLPGRLAPLDRASNRIERLLDGESAPRQRVLDDDIGRSAVDRFVTACNRLQARAPGHVVLALEGLEEAGATVHHEIAQLLRHPARFRLPLLIVLRNEPPESFREILEAIDAIEDSRATPTRPIDMMTKRVLRAAAVAGESFDADAVAGLLGLGRAEVLEALREARAVGITIFERGDGQLGRAAHAAPWSNRGGIEERLDAAARSVRAGDAKHAAEELTAAIDAMQMLERGADTTLLGARAMLERARLRWLGAGVDASFTLDGAFDEALMARAAMGAHAPARLRADVAAVIAGIAYDLGDGASVERAASVLASTIASLLDAGATADAAMLLNDQAALELRIGRATNARNLAARSIELLTARLREAPTDAAARADLAATHHLLARMPLHASTAVHDSGEIPQALAHATTAEGEYRALDMKRDVGRVIETRARLEARRGNVDAARISFETALRFADDAVDFTGLARITEGLAELLAATGNPRDALGLLTSSIELNREKASPIGLAFDERALGRIEEAVYALPTPDAELAAALEKTRAKLVRAMDLDGGAP